MNPTKLAHTPHYIPAVQHLTNKCFLKEANNDFCRTRRVLPVRAQERLLQASLGTLRERLLQVLRVVRRRLHRLHARRELGRDRLLERAEDLAVEVERQDPVEDGHGVLLEDRVLGEDLGHCLSGSQQDF